MSNNARDFTRAVTHVVDRILSRRRFGHYVGTVTGLGDLRTSTVAPEWAADVGIRNARRISSPLLDVIPKVGTKVAISSLDGVVEVPGVLGAIHDDEWADQSAWLRADLANVPGHVELGGTSSVSILAGANPGLDGHAGLGPGKVRIGNDAVDLVDQVDQIVIALQAAATALGANPTVESAAASAGGGLTTALTPIKAALATLKA